MKALSLTVLPWACAVRSPPTAESAPPAATNSGERDSSAFTGAQAQAIDTLERRLQELLDEGPAAGMAAAIVDRDGIVWAAGFGYADRESGRRVTIDTPFQIASISKTFIGLALMTEWDRGRLTLDTPVDDVLPFAVDNPRVEADTIRVWHLGTQTSGIRDREPVYSDSYAEGDPTVPLDAWLRSYLTPGGALYEADGNFLDARPGEVVEYSNIASALGALVAEHSSGLDYRELLRERVFEPLGMDNTSFDLADFEPHQLAVPYQLDEDGELASLAFYGFPTYPDGLLRTSVADLARVMAMLLSGGSLDGTRVVSREAIDAMWSELVPADEDGGADGHLYWIGLNGTYQFSGGDPGVHTVFYVRPEDGTGGVVLLNADYEPDRALLQAAIGAVSTARRTFDDPGDGG